MTGGDAQDPNRTEVGGQIDRDQLDRELGLDLVAHALGEGSERLRGRVRAAIAEDLELAVEFAETVDVLEQMRELSGGAGGIAAETGPSGRVQRAMAMEARHRVRLLGDRRGASARAAWPGLVLRVAAATVVWFGIGYAAFGAGLASLLRGEELDLSPQRALALVHEVPPAGLRAAVGLLSRDRSRESGERRELPVRDPGFVAAWEGLAARELPGRQGASRFGSWLDADNMLSRLRRESQLRTSPADRARLRRATGTPNVEDRVAALAAEVDRRVTAELAAASEPDAERADLFAVAQGLRGLLAAGSTTRVGAHHLTVQAAALELLDRLESATPTVVDRVAAIEALAEFAVVEGGHAAKLVATEVDRLAAETMTPGTEGARPALLHWSTPVGTLGAVGRVLQLAPAFGADAGAAFRARLAVAAHLDERLAQRPDLERPDVLVAQLYGFGDLVDRRDTDRRLSLWRARHLQPDYVAVHQLAWSRYPVRPGWADFQDELRRLAGQATPEGLADSGALLLTLCTNFAAPGIWDALVAVGI